MTHFERDSLDNIKARSLLGPSPLDDGEVGPSTENRWLARNDGADLVLSLLGEWTISKGVVNIVDLPLDGDHVVALRFDSTHLGRWDSALLVFLSTLRETARRRGIVFDPTGLPTAACRLMSMLPVEPRVERERARRPGMIVRVGLWALRGWSEVVAITTLVGEAILRSVPALRGRTRTRAADVWAKVHDAGIGALPMVALVNVLVGGIVAFVGSLQLRRFGAEIYVSNLIGVMEVREMAPLMTAIVMSGRTGSAYAAEIATMQGTEEIDALRAVGIPLFDYLTLPRVTALTTMMPMLCMYAGAVGILGGLTVAVYLMNISVGGFLTHLRGAVAGSDIVLGLVKSTAFGSWIAIAGCRIGLKAGRSATDVGHAATTAAVSGIVGVIALDAVFDVCANVFGI
jgi:phospholipid/cholesterol/gamma-HCH transport system permease protein